ncbi:hypothetical protein [Sphingobium bisphenolivorans]|uniref:hypothetical protein n=1 Tax=Sphingobium bisphenolivorans TaxID=1335760 RepID=UPI0003A55A48|nr:hypothetical protein [Sphingobium bisphenolivorans]
MDPHVSQHAIARYQQRVEYVHSSIVIERLTTPTIRKAIEFGAGCVLLGSGHRVVIKGFTIVTVKPPRVPRKWKGA